MSGRNGHADWVSSDGTIRLYRGGCLPAMAGLPDNSIDLIATDPPYFKVKNLPWDRQWDKPDDFIAWIGSLCEQWQRILKPNGSLYVFASPKMAARVECEVGRWFEVLNHIVWPKSDEATHALKYGDDRFRQYVQKSERIIFAEHFGADSHAKGESGYGTECDKLREFIFEPLRAYLDGERKRAGITRVEVDKAWQEERGTKGCMTPHWFGQSQFCGIPTESAYAWLQRLFNRSCNGDGPQYLRREHEDLRREYEDLRRPFSVSAEVPYTDVWDFPTVQAYPGKHPCEKPADMMRHIIEASSREGATVLDCFAGSHVTIAEAWRAGRKAIGVELDAEWHKQGRQRIERTIAKQTQPALFNKHEERQVEMLLPQEA